MNTLQWSFLSQPELTGILCTRCCPHSCPWLPHPTRFTPLVLYLGDAPMSAAGDAFPKGWHEPCGPSALHSLASGDPWVGVTPLGGGRWIRAVWVSLGCRDPCDRGKSPPTCCWARDFGALFDKMRLGGVGSAGGNW